MKKRKNNGIRKERRFTKSKKAEIKNAETGSGSVHESSSPVCYIEKEIFREGFEDLRPDEFENK